MKQFRRLIQSGRKLTSNMVLLAFGLAFGMNWSDASAQSAAMGLDAPSMVGQQVALAAKAQVDQPKGESKLTAPYYIEFRARSAQSYGHTFSIYGRLNERGGIATKTVAGLHPATESEVPWMIGHLVLVPSETGASDGDTEDQYVTSRFRVALTRDEYRKVTTYVNQLKKKSPVWHAVLYNCNTFVGDIAHFMGLETPGSTMLVPAKYIDRLRDLNISRAKTASLIGTPVKVEDAAELRAKALKALERGGKRTARTAASTSSAADTLPRHSPVFDR